MRFVYDTRGKTCMGVFATQAKIYSFQNTLLHTVDMFALQYGLFPHYVRPICKTTAQYTQEQCAKPHTNVENNKIVTPCAKYFLYRLNCQRHTHG